MIYWLNIISLLITAAIVGVVSKYAGLDRDETLLGMILGFLIVVIARLDSGLAALRQDMSKRGDD